MVRQRVQAAPPACSPECYLAAFLPAQAPIPLIAGPNPWRPSPLPTLRAAPADPSVPSRPAVGLGSRPGTHPAAGLFAQDFERSGAVGAPTGASGATRLLAGMLHRCISTGAGPDSPDRWATPVEGGRSRAGRPGSEPSPPYIVYTRELGGCRSIFWVHVAGFLEAV